MDWLKKFCVRLELGYRVRFGRRWGAAGAVVAFLLILAGVAFVKTDASAATKVSEGNLFVAADGNTYTYTLYDDDTAKLTHCNVANTRIVVPETVDGYRVTALGGDNLMDRFVDNSVTAIESIYINVPAINNSQFVHTNGTGITFGEVTIGEDVTSLGYSIFDYDTIEEFHYNATEASHSSFYSAMGSSSGVLNTTIGHLSIGDNVKKIPQAMFQYTNLEQDELELHTEIIGNSAFKSSGIHIGTLTFTEDVKTLGYFVTSYCTIDTFNYNIPKVNIANSLNSIFGGGSGAASTTNIGQINIGDNVEYIPTMAFEYINLDQDVLDINAATIGDNAFRGWDIHIGTLNIGEDVSKFGYCVFEGDVIDTVNYNAVSAVGSSIYSIFGPTTSVGNITDIGTLNMGAGVTNIPKQLFKYVTVDTLNYNSVYATTGGSSYEGLFEGSEVGQVNFADNIQKIPERLLFEATIGNTEITIPESVTVIGSKWASEVTADNLEDLYVNANTKTSSPGYTELDYKTLHIHRGSGFYDYFTHTNGGTIHQDMTLDTLCDAHMGDVEYEDDHGVENGCRHRDCTVCDYAFEKEYLIDVSKGNGISSAGTTGYHASGDVVSLTCEIMGGYEFSEWRDVVGDTTLASTQNFEYTVTDMAKSFRADARYIMHEVKFYDDNGTLLGELMVEHGGAAMAPPVEERAGYVRTWDKDFSVVTEDMVVTAVYTIKQFQVEWRDDDGTSLKQETVDYGGYGTPPEVPERDGNYFAWDKEYLNITEDMVITAVYTPMRFDVTWVDYDGTFLKMESVEYGDAGTPPDLPERVGYEFTGWDGDYSRITGNSWFTATYERLKFTVDWVDHDDSVLKSEEVGYGEDALPPDDPEWEGHEFVGWDMPYEDITEDTTITALYDVEVFSVVFKDYDGSVIDVVEVEYGEDAVPPEDPECEGHDFTGWDGDYTNVTENRIVTATFSARTYRVQWLDWDGTELKSESVEWGEEAEPPEEPEREGFVFDFWDRGFFVIYEDTIITAVYREEETGPVNYAYCTVTFVDWDGTVLKRENLLVGGNATAPDEPVRENYAFSGWDKEFSNVREDTTVTATYRQVTYPSPEVPEPEPVPEPDPQPEPQPQPAPQPQPSPEPTPVPAPDPNPVPNPKPAPTPNPDPTSPGTKPGDEYTPKKPDSGDGTGGRSEDPSSPSGDGSVGMTEGGGGDSSPSGTGGEGGLPAGVEGTDDGGEDPSSPSGDGSVGMTGEGTGDGTGDRTGGSDDGSGGQTDDNSNGDRNGGGSEDGLANGGNDLSDGDDGSDEDTGDGSEDPSYPEGQTSPSDDGSVGMTDDGGDQPGIPPIVPISAAGGSAGTGVWYFFWWRKRRKIRGFVIDSDGNPMVGMKMILSGKRVQETATDSKGEYAFQRVKDDLLELIAFDTEDRKLLSVEIMSKEKDVEEIFNVIEKNVANVEFDRSGKTLFVDVTV